MISIAVGQSGFSALLEEELTVLRGVKCQEKDDSAVLYNDKMLHKTVFPHFICESVSIIEADTVNNLAGSIFDFFINANKNHQIENTWNSIFIESKVINGLSRRSSSVSDAFDAIIKKRMSRISKLMNTGNKLEKGKHRGLFVYFFDFNKVAVGINFFYNGQRRMADDSVAPSRSYLKVEEAYGISGNSPGEGDIVVDLGAAPGGWSYSAAKRGAISYAIDNGPLKGGAKDNNHIIHLKSDAFKYVPEQKIDWLFCDMVEEPHRIIEIIEQWFTQRRCRAFVINFKFGHVNPITLIDEIEKNSIINKTEYTLIHLYHDRDELTITGLLV